MAAPKAPIREYMPPKRGDWTAMPPAIEAATIVICDSSRMPITQMTTNGAASVKLVATFAFAWLTASK